MKHTATLSLAFVSLAFLGSQFAHARTNGNTPAMTDDSGSDNAAQQANQMVPAEAALVKPLDSSKMQAGQSFQVKLSDGVHLKNGTDLPRGTMLVGTVATDGMQSSGVSRLVLRFTNAQLKNGSSIPIKATIVGMTAPVVSVTGTDEDAVNTWDPQTLKVDQVRVIPGVDLHSNIGSDNSGVLDANGRDSVHLGQNIHIALAIGPQGNS